MASSFKSQNNTEYTGNTAKQGTLEMESDYMTPHVIHTMAMFNAPPNVVKPEMSLPDEGFSQGQRLTRKLSRIEAVQSLDFDQLFEHPELSANMQRGSYTNQYGDSVDEGIASFEYDEGSPTSRSNVPDVDMNANNIRSTTMSGFTQTESVNVMDLTFKEILTKHKESSQGFVGFRRRVANDMNSKFFSYCRCDDVVFLFLYTIFGIIYICAGCLGLLYCTEYFLIKIYLIADGILSIFIFPISIMKWTKQVGGCLNEDEKMGRGVFFFTVIVMRAIAGTLGTLILVFQAHTFTSKEFLCVTLVMLLKVGVALEWAFLIFGIVFPLCFPISHAELSSPGYYLCNGLTPSLPRIVANSVILRFKLLYAYN